MKTPSLRHTTVLLVLALGLAVAQPASAMTDENGNSYFGYDDRRGDAPGPVDVISTQVDTSSSKRYVFTVDGQEFLKDESDFLRLYVDVDKNDSGPEYSVDVVFGRNPAAPVGQGGVARQDSWDTKSTRVPCNIRKSINYRTDVMTVSVPRACLGRPAGIDWAGFVSRIDRSTDIRIFGAFDFFPAERRFAPGGLVS